MHFILAAVEGENSETNLIKWSAKALSGQSARSGSLEVVPIALGGHHGYRGLVDIAIRAIEEYKADPDNCFEDGDSDEQWLIIDQDDMRKLRVSEAELRAEAEEKGLHFVITRPNLEFFILALLIGVEAAIEYAQTNNHRYIDGINEAIDDLNKKLGESGIKIPPYSKKAYMAQDCLGKLFCYYPNLVKCVANLNFDYDNPDFYSDLPKFFKRLIEVYEEQ